MARSSIFRGWHRKACIALSSGVAVMMGLLSPTHAERNSRPNPAPSSAELSVPERIEAVRAALVAQERTLPSPSWRLTQFYNYYPGPMSPGNFNAPPVIGYPSSPVIGGAGPYGAPYRPAAPGPYGTVIGPYGYVPQGQTLPMWRNF